MFVRDILRNPDLKSAGEANFAQYLIQHGGPSLGL
jgi:hypothetical protein